MMKRLHFLGLFILLGILRAIRKAKHQISTRCLGLWGNTAGCLSVQQQIDRRRDQFLV